jgi:PAS domain S-box-containing protein
MKFQTHAESKASLIEIQKYIWILLFIWTSVILGLLIWNLWQNHQNTMQIAIAEARANLNKDKAFRYWATSHGGVYVPVDEQTPPNPYLGNVPERDIDLPSGIKMTMMNPAYMVRQMNEQFVDMFGVRGHITSLKPLNPINAPDDWERSSLLSFERNNDESLMFTEINGDPYLRLMQPMITKEGCLKCHEHQGYKVGDVRGGVGIALPLASLLKIEHQENLSHLLTFGLLWLLGAAGLGKGGQSLNQRVRERNFAVIKMHEAHQQLQQERSIFLSGSVVVCKWKNKENLPVEYISANVKDFLGYKIEDFLQQDFFYADIIHPIDKIRVIDEIQKFSQEEIERFQHKPYRIVSLNRDVIWVLGHTSVVRDDKGRITHYIGYLVDITELKKAEELLRATDEKYRLLFENALEGIFQIAPNGQLISANPSLAAIFGFDSKDRMIQHIKSIEQSLIKPEDWDTLKKLAEKKAGIKHFEIKALRQDNTAIWIALNAQSVKDEKGTTIYYEGFVEDITDNRKAEQELKETKERLQTVMNSINALIYIADMESYELLFVNAYGLKVWGKDIVGQKCWKVIQGMEKPCSFCTNAKLINKKANNDNGTQWEFQSSANQRWYSITDRAIQWVDQRIVRMAVAMDITERKKAERMIVESEANARAIMESTSNIMILIDQNYCVLDTNEAHAKRLGLRREDLIGKSLEEFLPIEVAEQRKVLLGKVFQTGQPYVYEDSRAGYWNEIAIYPVWNSDGMIDRVAVFVQDATERKKAESQTQQIKKLEGLRRMAGAIAHHYNNLIAVVMGNLEMVIEDLSDDLPSNNELTEAINAARRASNIGGMMLDYLGQNIYQRELVNLVEICRSFLKDFQINLPKNIILETDLVDFDLVVNANSLKIKQVLENLLINAIESMADQGGIISIGLKKMAPSHINSQYIWPLDFSPKDIEFACLRIADQGGGIPENSFEKLFDPFYSSKFTGRGLGLPLALGIVKAHDGCISVESKLNQGSLFQVFLPLKTGAVIDSKVCPQKKNDAQWKNITILLVDDETAVREMGMKMLNRLGINVLEAKDGIDALNIFKAHQSEIKCVICDLTMPKMNGWETMEAIRKINLDVPIIIASGYDRIHVMEGARSGAPHAILSKPYSLAGLKDVLANALDH